MCQPLQIETASLPAWQLLRADDGSSRSSRLRSHWRYARPGWLASATVHVTAGCVTLAAAAWIHVQQGFVTAGQLELNATALPDHDSAPTIATLPYAADDPATTEALAHSVIEQLAREAVPPELRADLLDEQRPADPASATGQWVQARVMAEVAAAEKFTKEEKFQQLQALSGQLDRLSTAESVEAVTTRLAALLGTDTRAQQPAAEPVPGEFDFDTVQMHDVKRSGDGRGGFDYVGILLDAEGHTMETPLPPTEGEQLYRVMELVKSNPLLERVYRGLAMSLLDKLLKPTAAPTRRVDRRE
jgi:hypothetical protein